MEMGRTNQWDQTVAEFDMPCETHAKYEKRIKISIVKSERKRPFGRPSRRWENIKIESLKTQALKMWIGQSSIGGL